VVKRNAFHPEIDILLDSLHVMSCRTFSNSVNERGIGTSHYNPTRTKVSDSEIMRSSAEEDVSLFSRMFAGKFEHRDICHSCCISKFSAPENFVPVSYLIGHLKNFTVCVCCVLITN
jgi:hypothetical protein